MPFQLPTHTSGISATKVPINLEAINLLLLGQNDIKMPFTDPPTKLKKNQKFFLQVLNLQLLGLLIHMENGINMVQILNLKILQN